MKLRFSTLANVLAIACCTSTQAQAQLITLEPDHYARGTVLDHILPQVSLTSAGANNLPILPVPFPVTAQSIPPGFASTGSNVFAQAGVNFFNHDVRLRLDFNGFVQSLSLDAIGSGFNLLSERGHLEVYNAQNVLLIPTSPASSGALRWKR